jgi:hypothetical protein
MKEEKCYLCQVATSHGQKCPNCGLFYCCEDHFEAHQFKRPQDVVLKKGQAASETASAAAYCFPFRVEESEEFGRYFVATRDIEPLELVLVDEAAVVGPATKTKPICLECFKELETINETASEPIRCKGCEFPMCKMCIKMQEEKSGKYHTERECRILATSGLGTEVCTKVTVM